MKVSLFTFTIIVKKRQETLADAMRKEQLRKVSDTLIDRRVQTHYFN